MSKEAEKLDELQQKQERILYAINEDKKELELLAEQIATEQQKIVELEKVKSKLEDDLKTIEVKKDTQLGSLLKAKHHKIIADFKEKIAKEDDKLNTLISDGQKEIDFLTQEVGALEDKKSKLENSIKVGQQKFDKEVSQRNMQLAKLEQKLNELRDSLESKNTDLKNISDKVSKQEKLLDDYKLLCKEEANKVNSLIDKSNALKSEIEKRKEEFTTLENKVATINKAIVEVESTFESLSAQQKAEQNKLDTIIKQRINLVEQENILNQREAYIKSLYEKAGISIE